MKIIVEKARQAAELDSGTCNSGSNASGGQGSMCRADERPLDAADPAPTFAEVPDAL